MFTWHVCKFLLIGTCAMLVSESISHMCIHACVYAHTHAPTHTCTHAHTYIHAHTHTHTHNQHVDILMSTHIIVSQQLWN